MDIFVYIYLPGQTEAVPAGIFEYDPDQSLGIFRYGNRYRQRKDAVPVDPIALPLGENIKTCETNSGLYGAFRDASPDMWGRLVTAKALKVPPESLNAGKYLLHSSGLRVGNLDFRSSPKSPEPEHTVPTLRDIDGQEFLFVESATPSKGGHYDRPQRPIHHQRCRHPRIQRRVLTHCRS